MATDFHYIKAANVPMLTQELQATAISGAIQHIACTGTLLQIQTSRHLDTAEEKVLYSAVVAHSPPSMQEQAVKQKVTSAMQFGQQLLITFAAENVMLGLTTSQILIILQKYSAIQAMLLSGSLYTALQAMQQIPPDDIVTPARKTKYMNMIKNYLGIS